MKKSIIVLALALLMVGSVFADSTANKTSTATKTTAEPITASAKDVKDTTTTPLKDLTNKSEDTKVYVDLKLYPIYYAAITQSDVSSKLSKETDFTQDTYKHVTAIDLGVDLDNYTIEGTTSGSYYLSYFFYENTETVKLTVRLSGDLTTKDNRTATDKTKNPNAKFTIPYKVDITKSATETVTLVSSSNTIGNTEYTVKLSEDITTKPSTMVLGSYEKASYELNITPLVTDMTNNIAGLYESTITLALTATV